jgi:hypothetical protein
MHQLNDDVTAQRELTDLELARVIGGSPRFAAHVDNPGQRSLPSKLLAALQRLIQPIT